MTTIRIRQNRTIFVRTIDILAHQLVMNIISVMVLFGFGFIMPLLARRDVKKERLM
ncbi:hypothetical protein [Lacticaseibacillus paracasei]|uniref:hypothetical protein n=1 Tax=Lacticaseibacillus paracasei TaxID=1597 RepID=UPI001616F840|nr:hypothetical protein [Lacticaseibacillus paracasei]